MRWLLGVVVVALAGDAAAQPERMTEQCRIQRSAPGLLIDLEAARARDLRLGLEHLAMSRGTMVPASVHDARDALERELRAALAQAERTIRAAEDYQQALRVCARG